MFLKNRFENFLSRRDDIEIPGGDIALGVKFDGCATDKDWRGKSPLFDCNADPGKERQRGLELRPPTHSAATLALAFFPNNGARYRPV